MITCQISSTMSLSLNTPASFPHLNPLSVLSVSQLSVPSPALTLHSDKPVFRPSTSQCFSMAQLLSSPSAIYLVSISWFAAFTTVCHFCCLHTISFPC